MSSPNKSVLRNSRLMAMIASAMQSAAPIHPQLPELTSPYPKRSGRSMTWCSTTKYDPDRFRNHEQRKADAADKRARRMERNRNLLSIGAVERVRP